MQVESRDSVSLKPAELDELGQLLASVGLSGMDNELEGHVEHFPLVVVAVEDDDIHGFLFGSLERVGGTPCILWGLGAARRGRQAGAAVKGMVGELYRRAAISFPDEDVLVAGRIAHPAAYCLLAASPTSCRARTTRPRVRSGPGVVASPVASAATPATTTGRSGSPTGQPRGGARREHGQGWRQGRDRGRRRRRPTRGEAVIAFGWATADALANGLGHTDPPATARSAFGVTSRRRVTTPKRGRSGSAGGEGGVDLGAQGFGGRDREPAGEVLAHVRRRLARRRGRGRRGAGSRRRRCRARPDRDRRRDEPAEHLVAQGGIGADERDLDRRGERPLVGAEQDREGDVRARDRRRAGRAAGGASPRASSSPVTAASRSSPSAASEFSDGVALSKKSCGRTMSASASVPGREEAAALRVGEEPEQLVGAPARVLEPGDVVVLGHGHERPEQRGVVLGDREVAGAAVGLPRPQQPAVVAAQRA